MARLLPSHPLLQYKVRFEIAEAGNFKYEEYAYDNLSFY